MDKRIQLVVEGLASTHTSIIVKVSRRVMATDQNTSGCASGGDNVVPVLDFSKPDNELSADLYAALSTVGFACLVNTGVWEKVSAGTYFNSTPFSCSINFDVVSSLISDISVH